MIDSHVTSVGRTMRPPSGTLGSTSWTSSGRRSEPRATAPLPHHFGLPGGWCSFRMPFAHLCTAQEARIGSTRAVHQRHALAKNTNSKQLTYLQAVCGFQRVHGSSKGLRLSKGSRIIGTCQSKIANWIPLKDCLRKEMPFSP